MLLETMSQLLRSVAWVLFSVVAAGIIAWLAVGLQLSGRAMFGVLSLGIGVAVGLVVVGFALFVGTRGRRAMAGLAVILAFATVAAEHGFFYLEYVAAWHKQRLETPALEIFRPDERPKDYWTYMLDSAKSKIGMTGERDESFHRWILWLVDLVLVVFGASLVVFVASKYNRQSVTTRTCTPRA